MARAAYIYAAIFVLAEKQVFYMKRFFSFFFANTCNRTCTCSPLATCNCILATVSFCSQPGRTSSLNTSFTTALKSKEKSKQLKKKNYTHFWRAQLRSWKTSSYSCTSAQRHHCNRLQLQRCTTHDTKQAAFDCASVQPTSQPVMSPSLTCCRWPAVNNAWHYVVDCCNCFLTLLLVYDSLHVIVVVGVVMALHLYCYMHTFELSNLQLFFFDNFF